MNADGIVGGDLVAGELEPDELVVGHVAVQGLDDPVAIPPGVGPGLVELEAVGVGVARQVEPVLRPALAVVRAGQQTIDDRLVGIRRAVGEERRRPPRASAAGRSGRSSARRSSVGRSASGAGRSSFSSSVARMKASIGLRTQPVSLDLTERAGRSAAWNAQCSRSSAVIGFSAASSSAPRRQTRHQQERMRRPERARCMGDVTVSEVSHRPQARIASDDLARRVGQAVVAAVVGEGEPGVVEAEQVEDRGVEVVDVDAVDLGAEADGVGRAVDRAALDPRAGHPDGRSRAGCGRGPCRSRTSASGRTRRPR